MKEIFDWLREQVYGNNDKAKNFSKDTHVVNKEYIDNIITEAEAKWKEKEAELRANVIEEFADLLKRICDKYPLGIDRKYQRPTYAHEDGTWHNLINDVVKQMRKGEQT